MFSPVRVTAPVPWTAYSPHCRNSRRPSRRTGNLLGFDQREKLVKTVKPDAVKQRETMRTEKEKRTLLNYLAEAVRLGTISPDNGG